MARSPLEKCLWWGLLLGDNQWSGARFRSRFSDETICAMWELLSRYWVQQPLYSSPPASSGRVKSRRGRLVISVLTKQSKPRSCSSCSRSWLSYHQKLRSTKPAHRQSWGNTEMFFNSNSLEIAALTTDHWPRSEENKYLSSREPTCGTETGFTGRRRTEKASIILMILFSFEVDTLEISLREIQDVVDHIFIVESSITHRGVFYLKSWKVKVQ